MAGEKQYKVTFTIDGQLITATGYIQPKQGLQGPTGPQGPARLEPPQEILNVWPTAPSGYFATNYPSVKFEGGKVYTKTLDSSYQEEINLNGANGGQGYQGASGQQGATVYQDTIIWPGLNTDADVSGKVPVAGGLIYDGEEVQTTITMPGGSQMTMVQFRVNKVYPVTSDQKIYKSRNISCIGSVGPTGAAGLSSMSIEVTPIE